MHLFTYSMSNIVIPVTIVLLSSEVAFDLVKSGFDGRLTDTWLNRILNTDFMCS